MKNKNINEIFNDWNVEENYDGYELLNNISKLKSGDNVKIKNYSDLIKKVDISYGKIITINRNAKTILIGNRKNEDKTKNLRRRHFNIDKIKIYRRK